MSSATYATGDAGVDFGNTYYNDHHFHYGYHILAAAMIGYMDPEWAKANADYVNTLARDIANPSSEDKVFPMWRNFDWYHGHSWAHGLYASTDGKVGGRRAAWACSDVADEEAFAGPRVELGRHDARVRAQDVGQGDGKQQPRGEVRGSGAGSARVEG